MSPTPSIDSLWLPYTQMATAPAPLPVVGADGVRIELADGRRLIDGISSWWTACHGYNHPHIRAAVAAQLDKLPHVMFSGLVHEPGLTLARRLIALLPRDERRQPERVFFSESGSVAVEIALKMAVQYWHNRGEDRTRFVAFRDGYHGDTLGALSVTDPGSGFHDAFAAYRVPTDLCRPAARRPRTHTAFDALLDRHSQEIAAVIVEPLRAGRRRHALPRRRHARLHPRRLRPPRRAADRRRDHDRLRPHRHAVRLRKCGHRARHHLPVEGADRRHAAARRDCCDAVTCSPPSAPHATKTPSCTARPSWPIRSPAPPPIASLDLFEREPRLAQVAAIAAQMAAELEPCRALPGVVDVRVKGAIGVVQLATTEASALRPAFVERGVWVRPFGDIVYLDAALRHRAQPICATLTAAVCEVVTDWSRAHG